MRIIKGRGIVPEITVGRFCLLDKNGEKASEKGYVPRNSPEEELVRFNDAVSAAEERFTHLAKEARIRAGESEADIFETHRLMLTDEDFAGTAREIIESGTDALTAVKSSGDTLKALLLSSDSDYMRQRAADVEAICMELCEILTGSGDGEVRLSVPAVIGAFDLTPAETLTLDRNMVLGFVTGAGGSNSHTAILARSMGIPAVVGAGEIPEEADGATVILDGCEGLLIISPDDATLEVYKKRMKDAKRAREMEERVPIDPIFINGNRIRVCANIADSGESVRAKSAGADGIGLFRSEFLYMKYGREPTEEEQYHAYCEAAVGCEGEVIIRTLDAGADKEIPYLGIEPEPNPALGLRAVRLCLSREEMFRTQIKALLRASHKRRIGILIPMISEVEEFLRVKAIIESVKTSLSCDGIPFSDTTPVGVMIETPSAALTSDILAHHADFFCVGTNDLIQYVMAADRQNGDVAYLCEGVPEAVRRLLKHVADCAKTAGIWSGICGEAASDTAFTEFFIECGFTELSVNIPMIMSVKKKLLSLSDGDTVAFRAEEKSYEA